ncbi:MmcB family DNA repair protein [Hyphomicrobium sp.]|uniref:MmcB family DNA repair protein n=1 Tax=Hyphomicrobium sp. TaxID=82 RepID=UPI0025C5AC68|nr:MmcB family DNA repair protein [Hyphomicrobium sp.]MCC7252789.1 MmcB family DNA repair protein [Hyphomicrobium sp.]
MTDIEDHVDNAVNRMSITEPSLGGPQSPVAREICRGVVRVLAAHGLTAIAELSLPNGRRADVVGLGPDGMIWIVEIKSCLEDFRTDRKWPEYREYSDRLFFGVTPEFPQEILPEDAGLIVADRYGGEILRPAPELRLAAHTRKAMTLRVARASASRLSVLLDPTLPAAVGLGIGDA